MTSTSSSATAINANSPKLDLAEIASRFNTKLQFVTLNCYDGTIKVERSNAKAIATKINTDKFKIIDTINTYDVQCTRKEVMVIMDIILTEETAKAAAANKVVTDNNVNKDQDAAAKLAEAAAKARQDANKALVEEAAKVAAAVKAKEEADLKDKAAKEQEAATKLIEEAFKAKEQEAATKLAEAAAKARHDADLKDKALIEEAAAKAKEEADKAAKAKITDVLLTDTSSTGRTVYFTQNGIVKTAGLFHMEIKDIVTMVYINLTDGMSFSLRMNKSAFTKKPWANLFNEQYKEHADLFDAIFTVSKTHIVNSVKVTKTNIPSMPFTVKILDKDYIATIANTNVRLSTSTDSKVELLDNSDPNMSLTDVIKKAISDGKLDAWFNI